MKLLLTVALVSVSCLNVKAEALEGSIAFYLDGTYQPDNNFQVQTNATQAELLVGWDKSGFISTVEGANLTIRTKGAQGSLIYPGNLLLTANEGWATGHIIMDSPVTISNQPLHLVANDPGTNFFQEIVNITTGTNGYPDWQLLASGNDLMFFSGGSGMVSAMGFLSGSTYTYKLVLDNPYIPSSSSATGERGTITWDSNYLYWCYAPNSWNRVPRDSSW